MHRLVLGSGIINSTIITPVLGGFKEREENREGRKGVTATTYRHDICVAGGQQDVSSKPGAPPAASHTQVWG